MPGVSGNTLYGFVSEMWNRNGYGTAATALIREFPVSGIGVGGFHMFGPRLGVGRRYSPPTMPRIGTATR